MNVSLTYENCARHAYSVIQESGVTIAFYVVVVVALVSALYSYYVFAFGKKISLRQDLSDAIKTHSLTSNRLLSRGKSAKYI